LTTIKSVFGIRALAWPTAARMPEQIPEAARIRHAVATFVLNSLSIFFAMDFCSEIFSSSITLPALRSTKPDKIPPPQV
jgi:hypothetical protein